MSNTSYKKVYRIGIDARLWGETGVGRYIRNLVKELQKIDTANNYVLFVGSKNTHEAQLSIDNSNWSIVTTDIRWHTVAEQLKFPKILATHHLDLVHFPYFSVPLFYKGKFVLTIHDLILHHFPTGKASTHSWLIYRLKHMAYTYIISHAAKKAKKIITVSNATKKEIVEDLHVPRENIIVTYEGVDKKITSSKGEVKGSLGKYFLYVGNAYPHKNLERLVEAFAYLVRGPVAPHPQNSLPSHSFSPEEFRGTPSCATPFGDMKLILVGKEDFFYSRLEKKVKELGLSEVILFKHSVRDEELANLYKNSLALVMPSLMEGFGLPILEAMANGSLVACSDIPVFHEIAGDSPVYFQPTDTTSVSNVLESIAKGNVPHGEKKKNAEQTIKKFTWKKTGEQTLAVYKNCLSL